MNGLTLRDVEIDGRSGLDVRLEDGRVAEVGPGLRRSAEEIDGQGGALIPGLCDHHIHIFGLAAKRESVALDRVADARGFGEAIEAAAAARPKGKWIRALGYHERMAGELTRHALDALAPQHPIRVQHQTGSLWVFNSLGLAALSAGDDPPGLDRGAGRLWRGDAWLRTRLDSEPPALATVGRDLAAWGVTALTDASVTTDQATAERLGEAHRAGDLPQRLLLMSGGPLRAPTDTAFAVGPVKVLLDEHDLPSIDDFAARIRRARDWGRVVAVHCVTAAELAVTLAAFEEAGARPGDRIEHGSVIPAAAVAQIVELGLAVVTQPAFLRERGDRYLADVDPAEQGDLYRCRSLIAAGVPLAASSDAPYADPDPWAAMAAAVDRRTAAGREIGEKESLTASAAMALYLDTAARPGRSRRRIVRGADADLCLLRTSIREALADLDAGNVRATVIGGRLVHGG